MDMEICDRAPEHKDGIPAGDLVTLDDVRRLFEEFKAAQDESIDQKARRAADAITTEKVERINAELTRKLDELTLKSTRPALAAEPAASADEAREHKMAFESYMRSGDVAALRALEIKALSAGSNPDGGYTVPEEIERLIGKRLTEISPIRAIASVRQISSNVYRKPFMTAGPAVGWVGESGARPQTATPVLDQLSFPAMELYAQPAATATLLEDSAVNIDEWLAAEVDQAFAAQEGSAFVAGDGVNQPKGFLAYLTIDNASWQWGKIGTVSTGLDGAFPASNPSDKLIDLAYAVKSGYRQNAVFVMNRKTQSELRKFKDASGNYIWQPPITASGRPSLMTFPVIEAEDMPDIDDGSLSIAFGDFGRGYLVVDRAGARVLRDPFTAKPYVLFYTTKRVGGGVQNYDAIKLLKFAAS